MSLRSHGGGELNIVRQATCRVSRDNFVVETFLQVQKEAPVDLLLEIDVLSRLGFVFSKVEKDGKFTDLLKSDSSTSVMEGVTKSRAGST